MIYWMVRLVFNFDAGEGCYPIADELFNPKNALAEIHITRVNIYKKRNVTQMNGGCNDP